MGTTALDERINRLYGRFAGLADRFGYRFVRPVIAVRGCPNVLFLGNHSAGKSTFINYLLGGEPVQMTGVAPTDDGFTLVRYGDEERDYNGPAALKYLGADFASLDRLGPAFLRRLRVKVRRRELLQKVHLIDSPGMIDAASSEAQRDYDFMATVRRMADISDLVLFMFDPDKPGTTGEALAALKQCLVGMEFKLHILMNKADSFDNMYDFARACGALCWNLARAMRSKDLPPIYTTYVPVGAERTSHMPLADFDRYREEVATQVRNAGQRRSDNMIAMVREDFPRLAMHVRVISAFRRKVAAYSLRGWLFGLLGATLAAAAVFWTVTTWWKWVFMTVLAGAILAACGTAVRRLARQRADRLLGNLDGIFQQLYMRELTMEKRDDLRQTWTAIRGDLPTIVGNVGRRMPMFPGRAWHRLNRVIAHDIPRLGAD